MSVLPAWHVSAGYSQSLSDPAGSGVIVWRHGAAVILGCFILFGATSMWPASNRLPVSAN